MLDELHDLLRHQAGYPFPDRDEEYAAIARKDEEQMYGARENDLHEHRCPSPRCGNYWSCRKRDCTPHDVCDECEREKWVDAHDPQPELPLVSERLRAE